MGADPAPQKRALRAALRARRRALPAEERAAATTGLTERLTGLTERVGAASVSCYLSAADEPDTRPYLARMRAGGTRVLLPVTRDDGLLDWAAATEQGRERVGPTGVPEPVGEPLGPAAIEGVELILVPAAAVDASGMRLGWGRGYYDRTLEALERRPPVYAVVFDSELVDAVPSERHDQAVDGVVTPTRTVEFAPRSPRRARPADGGSDARMPVYAYTCRDCGTPLEVHQEFSDAALTVCPVCGGRLRKQYGSIGVTFNGSGFYRTDSRAGESKGGAGEGGSTSEGSGGGSGKTDGAKADAPKTESKPAAPKPAAPSGSPSSS